MNSTKYDTNKRRMTIPMFWIVGMGVIALVIDLIRFGNETVPVPSNFYYTFIILMAVLMARFAWKDSTYSKKDLVVLFFVLCVLSEVLLEATGKLTQVGIPDLLFDLTWIATGFIFNKASVFSED